MIQIDIFSEKDPFVQLQKLKKKEVKRLLTPIMNEHGRPIREAIKARVPVKFGYLKRAVGMQVKTGRTATYLIAGIRSDKVFQGKIITRGPKKGTVRQYRPSKIANILEKGSKRSKATPFLEPAKSNLAMTFFDNVKKDLGIKIEAVLDK